MREPDARRPRRSSSSARKGEALNDVLARIPAADQERGEPEHGQHAHEPAVERAKRMADQDYHRGQGQCPERSARENPLALPVNQARTDSHGCASVAMHGLQRKRSRESRRKLHTAEFWVLWSRSSSTRRAEQVVIMGSHHGKSVMTGSSMSKSMSHRVASSKPRHDSMLGMAMHKPHSSMTAMGGMSIGAGHGATNILPNWLAVIWTLIFLVIVVVHVRHVLETHGERRFWHSGHVLMALGMMFMFAPGSLDHFNIPSSFWQIAFANAAGAIVIWMLAQALSGHALNMLWVVIAIDLASMVYMWTPGGFVAPITWLLVAYFGTQALLWVTNRYRRLDERPLLAGISVAGSGTLSASAATPLICERDLRWSMSLMTLGMAYMFAAMQLLS